MILSGGEPFYLAGGPFGCLLVHGFVSAPQEMRWLGDQLNEAGFTVLGVRLFGHATHPSDLHRARASDWIASMEDGLYLLNGQCEKVVVIGLSMGGALALIAGGTLPVDGVVAISTPHTIPPYPKLNWLAPLLPSLRWVSAGLRNLPKPPPLDYHDPEASSDHLTYSVFPTRAIPELAVLLEEMRRVLPDISVPTLLIHSHADRGVPHKNATTILDQLGTKRAKILTVHRSGHVITLEPERERVADSIISFVANLSRSAS